MPRFVHRCAIAIAAVLSAAASTARAQPHPVLEGVEAIAAPGVPGPIFITGPDARALVAARAGPGARAAAVAVSALGKGRVVALGHTGYLDPGNFDEADTGRLLENAMRWAGGRTDPTVLCIDNRPLADALTARGFASRPVATRELSARSLAGVHVVALTHAALTAEQRSLLQGFARDGGGLVVAGLGWGWHQLNPSRSLYEHPGTLLLAPAGLGWADGTLEKGGKNRFGIEQLDLTLLNASAALDLLELTPRPAGLPADAVPQAAASATLAARSVIPGDDIFLPRVEALIQRHSARLIPTPAAPFELRARALDRFILAASLRRLEVAPADEVTAHPAAAAFPGTVPNDAPRIERTLAIDGDARGWQSTGLYAAPGEVISIDAPPSAKLRVQIGSHTDRLWHKDAWHRVPEIVRSWPMNSLPCRIASPFGGLIYVLPDERGPSAAVQVTIRDAVAAPRYVHGITTIDQWKSEQRSLAGPWAELETSKLILTVPATAIRTLDDPVALMNFWDRVLDADADLATIPRERRRPERIVADVQISAGYMHSGYPIMTHLDAAAAMTTLKDLQTGKSAWGLFHELGHNHQSGDWTFDGTVEVTCNLFTLYALDTVCTLPPGQRGHAGVDKPPRTLEEYLAKPDFAAWKSNPFLALHMYVQMQAEFGWEPFKTVFAQYRNLGKGEGPSNDQEKRDQWMVRFSRTVGRNLGPFFQAWGVPTSDAARASIKDLPEWMPASMQK